MVIIFLIAPHINNFVDWKKFGKLPKKKIQEDNVEWVDQKEVILIKVKLDGVKFK